MAVAESPRDPAALDVAATPIEHEAPTEEERQVYAAGVFESQPYDPSWARESTRHLTTVLTALSVPGVRTNSVECRTNLCRVEVSAESSRAGESFVRGFIRSASVGGSGMAVREEPDARGAYVMRLYLTRKGTPLPEPPLVGDEP